MTRITLLLFLAACAPEPTPPSIADVAVEHGYRTISTAILHTWITRGDEITVIDVRSQGEYASGHIEGSQLIPIETVKARASELPRDKPVYVICEAGARSKAAAQTLSSLGVQVVDVHDGMSGWRGAGYPTVK